MDSNDLEYLKNRARYYDEMPTKAEYLALLQEFIDHIDNDNKYNEGFDDGEKKGYEEGLEEGKKITVDNSVPSKYKEEVKRKAVLASIKLNDCLYTGKIGDIKRYIKYVLNNQIEDLRNMDTLE